MTVPTSRSADQSVGALLRELAEGSSELLRKEWQLARLELAGLAKQMGIGTSEVAIGGVCFAMGGVGVLVGAVLALADPWVHQHVTLALTVGVVVLVAIALWLATSGIKTLASTSFAGKRVTED
ncbi:MAG: phage holin family protein [Gemmatimonadaceae bacterium]|nr:phage holin family protein [Gemmatimonadaceae bacterium]